MSITPRQSPYTLCPSPYCIDVRDILSTSFIFWWVFKTNSDEIIVLGCLDTIFAPKQFIVSFGSQRISTAAAASDFVTSHALHLVPFVFTSVRRKREAKWETVRDGDDPGRLSVYFSGQVSNVIEDVFRRVERFLWVD